MELDVQQASALFLEHNDKISPDLVVSRLQAKPFLLFKVGLLQRSSLEVLCESRNPPSNFIIKVSKL